MVQNINTNSFDTHLIDKKLIQLISKHIAQNYNPQKIILFGSRATNSSTNSSDIDLLIVKETKENFIQRTREVKSLIRPRRFGLDVIVLTPTELQNELNYENEFFLEIMKSGRTLYDQEKS